MVNILKISHKNEDRIKVVFPYNQEMASTIRQIPDAKWSRTHRAWHIPYSRAAFNQLLTLFPNSIIDGETQPNPLSANIAIQEVAPSQTKTAHPVIDTELQVVALPTLNGNIILEKLDGKGH